MSHLATGQTKEENTTVGVARNTSLQPDQPDEGTNPVSKLCMKESASRANDLGASEEEGEQEEEETSGSSVAGDSSQEKEPQRTTLSREEIEALANLLSREEIEALANLIPEPELTACTELLKQLMSEENGQRRNDGHVTNAGADEFPFGTSNRTSSRLEGEALHGADF